MSQFPTFNNCEIFSQFSQSDMPDGAQPYDPRWHSSDPNSDCPSLEEIYSEESSQEPPPQVFVDNNNNDIIFTNTKNIRTVLASISGYNHGQLGNHLRLKIGLIILPVDAISAIRIPTNTHSLDHPCILFYPTKPLNQYPTLSNFTESIQLLENAKNS